MSAPQLIDIDLIQKRADARPIHLKTLERLEASIPIDGLIHAIHVRRLGDGYEVVSGHHRLAAHDALGRRKIEAIVVDVDDIRAEMAMLSENICRAELSALERDRQLVRWMELSGIETSLDDADTSTAGATDAFQVETHRKAGQQAGGINAAARHLGVSKSDAHRAVQVASLSDEAVETAREVGLDDNRTALLKASRAEPERQAEVLRAHAAQRQGGISGRYQAAAPAAADHAVVWRRFLDAADVIEGLPIQSVIAGAGTGRAKLSQRAHSLADRMDAIREALS